MGKGKVLIASCFWIAASFAQTWAAGPGEALPSSHPYPFYVIVERDAPVSTNPKALHPASSRDYFASALEGTDTAIQGSKARYDMSLGDFNFELSGGYLPGVKSLAPSEAPLDIKASMAYVNLTIPLDSFYLRGGAFFGQNMEALGLVLTHPKNEQRAQRELFGYQLGGGYRFSDSLSVQAGWGQAAQEYENVREGLRALYLQAQISLGWRMSVTPQVGYIDFTKGDGEKIREEAFYCGARWQISF